MQTNQDRVDSFVALSATLTSLAALAVIVRTYIRFVLIRKPGWDDYVIIAAVIFTFAYLAEILVGRANGMGFPATTLLPSQTLVFMKTVLAIEVTYYIIVGLVKTSILLMYLRFAITDCLTYACYGTIIFEIVFTAICVIVTLGQCVPLQKMWDLSGTENGTCGVDTTAFFYSTSGINILTDVWVLAIPVKTLATVQRPVGEKACLMAVFMAGTVSSVMSMIRLYSIHIYTQSADPIHDAIPVNQWSMIEINIAIICASVPALKPLITPRRLRYAIEERKHKYHGSSGDTKSSLRDKIRNSRKSFHALVHPEIDLVKLAQMSGPNSQSTTPVDDDDRDIMTTEDVTTSDLRLPKQGTYDSV